MCSLVTDFDFDVFGVSETWLDPNTPSDSYEIPGYTLLRADRDVLTSHSPLTGGGGVAVYIKDSIVFDQYQLIEVDPDIDHISLVLKIKGAKLGVCIVYRPPHVKYTCLKSLFHSLFVEMAVEVDSVFYLGDSNIDLLASGKYDRKFLCRLLKESNAFQHVREATRVTEHSATLIDHIITDRATQIETCGVIDASTIIDKRGVKMTDHKLIHCSIKCARDKKAAKCVKYRDYTNFNVKNVVSEVAKIDWNKAKQLQGVQDIESFVTENIKKVYDKHAPIVSKRITRKRAPWRNDEIVRLTKKKSKLKNKYWKSRSKDDWEAYKKTRNELNSLIRNAKKTFFSNKLTGCDDSKEFWKCLRQGNVVGGKNTSSQTSKFDIEDINEHFVNMGSDCSTDKETEDFYRHNKYVGLKGSFQFKTVSENEVKSAMNEISSNAVGSDDVTIDMIKSVSPYALGAITHLVNQSLMGDEFPQTWKISIVHPLPKTQNPSNANDLRPISVLPALSKILEKIATRQMLSYLENEKILPTLQSGFRRNHSTCTALVNLFGDMFEARDRSRCSTLVMLDYSQAFDSLSHDMLLAKMHYFGFENSAVDWFRSYLEDRVQITKIDTILSSPLSKTRGVPQGSCLGPVLFSFYTADLPNCIVRCNAHAYADDLQVHLSYKPDSVHEALSNINADLNSISKWSSNHGLKLNISKCTVMHVGSPHVLLRVKQSPLQVMLEGKSLAIRDSVKNLGVMLDSDLSFSDHVTYACQRALGRLRGLYRFRTLLPEAAKLKIIESLVLSVFYYCFPAYGNSISREDVSRIQKMQNTALRFVYNLSKRNHISAYRDAAHLLPMETVCRIQTCCMVHKVLNLKEPCYLYDRLLFREEVSQRTTRQDGKLHFPKVSLEIGRKGFNYFGPTLYNDLPCEFRNYSSTTFKKKLKSLFSAVTKTEL